MASRRFASDETATKAQRRVTLVQNLRGKRPVVQSTWMQMNSSIPLREARGACPLDCPDTCSWIVTVKGTPTAEA